MQTNPLLQEKPNLQEIAKATGKDYQQVHRLYSGKAKKPLVSWEQFLMAHFCTNNNIDIQDLNTLRNERNGLKSNWCKSNPNGLVRYDEISNNKALWMLFTQDGQFLNSSAELKDKVEEIKTLLFP